MVVNHKLFMRKVAFLLAGLACLLGRAALAAGTPRGNLLELHSCELYAGGCIVSSEATLDGRYMLRAWDFTGGSFAGTDLAGLKVALLQASNENLAAPGSAAAGRAVVYLPADATAAQREVLLAWVKSTQKGMMPAECEARTVPLTFTKTVNGYALSGGQYFSVSTAPLETCESGACGEALWYTPRSSSSRFTVAVDHASRVMEPLLALRWEEAGKRNVFLAKFGEASPVKETFVSSADFCSAANGKLF